MFVRDNRMLLRCCMLLIAAMALAVTAAALGDEGLKERETATGVATAASTGDTAVMDREISKSHDSIKADPSNVSAHVRLGYLLIRRGDLDGAMSAFDEALRLNSRSHIAKTGKGIVLVRKGDFKSAELMLKDALLLNPNPVRTHYELGLLYEKLNEHQKALAEFKEGIRKHEQESM